MESLPALGPAWARALPVLIAASALMGCESARIAGSASEVRVETSEPYASAPLPLSPLPLPEDLPLAELEAGVPPSATGATRAGSDAGARPSPTWLRPGEALEADAVKERELLGIRLEGEWRWSDLPPPSRAPEVSSSGIEAARQATAFKWTIDLAETGRMRVRFASKTFLLPHGTELRARIDRYGHLLVWPDATRYRTLPPGTLRALLGERRVDLSPLTRPRIGSAGKGTRRFGLATRRTEASTRTGSLTLEQAKIPEAGEGGALLCRLFAELVAVDPSAADCIAGEVPLRAQFGWSQGGSIAFEVTAMQHRPDIPASLLLMPPPSAAQTSELPPSGTGLLLSPKELASFRLRAVGLAPPTPGKPNEGLVAYNGTDLLRYVLVDGVPVAWISPWQEQHIPHLPGGRYVVGWRSFFAEDAASSETIDLPARIPAGAGVDAGVGISPRSPRP